MADKFELNDTTPAAPGGRVNVLWQSDVNGNVSAHVSPGSSITLQDEGTPLTQRSILNFAGPGVTVTDDAINSRTVITIPGGGSQSPWTSDIDAAGFALSSVRHVRLTNAGGTAGAQFQISGSGNDCFFQNEASGRIFFFSGGAERFIIGTSSVYLPSGGKFGIGMYNPSYPLDVIGDCNLSAGSVYRINGVAVGSQTPWTSDIDGNSKKLSNVSMLGIGKVPTAVLDVVGPHIYHTNGAVIGRLYAEPAAGAYFFGTVSNHDLIVRTNDTNRLELTTFGVFNYYAPRIYQIDSGIQAQMAVISGAYYFGTFSNHDMYLRTNDQNRILIQTGGNVGIGNVNPQCKLEVTGDVHAQAYNYIASETGANNALVASLPGVSLAAGLEIRLLLAHTLQVGANTLNLNGAGVKNIRSHKNPASNIAAAYTVGCVVYLIYDGTQWQDQSQ